MGPLPGKALGEFSNLWRHPASNHAIVSVNVASLIFYNMVLDENVSKGGFRKSTSA